MTINNRHVETTCDELMNHTLWHERVSSRYKVKGYGDKTFRVFECDCGSGYKISIGMTEAIGFSLSSMKFSKPCIIPMFTTLYGTSSFRRTEISGCKNRTDFYLKLYNHLDKSYPMSNEEK